MKTWQRMILLVCGLLCAMAWVYAQAPTEAQRAEMEKQADTLFIQGEGRMKVSSYEEAIEEFRKILKRYPETTARYKAQFRIADAMIALKKEADALALLESVVNEESPTWSPQALTRIGELYTTQEKYTEAFRAYRKIFLDYPNSPMVDRAHFAIGVTHFRLGHYEQAVQELDKVGTGYAMHSPELQRVSPGEVLWVRVIEPNMVADAKASLPVTVSGTSGDKETIVLTPEMEGGDHFSSAIPTALGAAKPGDGVLHLHGTDTVTLSYKSRYMGDGAENRKIEMGTASSARMTIFDSQGSEVRGVVVSDTMTVQVHDADRDVSDKPDIIEVALTTKKQDQETLTLTETGPHTGVFRGEMKTKMAEPAPTSGVIETQGDFAEGSVTQYDDTITVSYRDEQHLVVNINGPRTLAQKVGLYAAANAEATAVEAQIPKSELEIQALLYKGRSLSQIAATYRDLGQAAKATQNFREADRFFREVVTRYPQAPEVEDALYGQFENYVVQEAYTSAVGVIKEITRRFPQSSRASEALLKLAMIYVKQEEYGPALAIYRGLAQSAKGTPLGEQAQYAICTTNLEMLKPKAGYMKKPPAITREQATLALEEFVRAFPESRLAPEALWNLVRIRFEGEDYAGAIDSARRMEMMFPDDVMTGRVLLMQGKAFFKIRDYQSARQTFLTIIANYGAEAEQAKSLLNQLPKPKTTTPAGNP